MKKASLPLLFFCLSLLTGCATYHLSTQSLVEQFGNSSTEKKKILLPVFPYLFFVDPVTGNDLQTIKVLDKNGQEKILTVTNRTGVRITRTDSSRTTFYFNTLLLKDSTITGSKTHFFNAHIKPINFRDISKIEIQK
jgi:hypothetical protein